MNQPIIDEGIVTAETGLKFRYRCFLNLPIGMAILYPEDKTPETLEQEIQLEHEHYETVFWQNTGQVLPVFKHPDGSVEVPKVLLNIYKGIIDEKFQLIYVVEMYEKEHLQLMAIFKNNYDYQRATE